MLTPEELKCALETLSQRQSWMAKALSENKVAEKDRASYEEKIRLLDAVSRKLQMVKIADAQPAQKKLRILLIDDDPVSRELLKTMLEELDQKNILESESGEEGLEILSRDLNFDLILSDWQMPGLSGFDLLKKIREAEATKKLPFIMVTGRSDMEYIQSAIKAGVNDYIVKPIDMNVLEKKISRYTHPSN
ncbi:MAG TPA: response regulator [Pseudomonadales bacterium]|nr:response regulator [Pseudomonadales bacterium]